MPFKLPIFKYNQIDNLLTNIDIAFITYNPH